ncbi:hypothetical protein C8J57DRAFT_1510119 [Mycena rebaudengoi]|nr:hypothetical protein C8J57DRAFT_1510119 [Mycena rebaudengoi]
MTEILYFLHSTYLLLFDSIVDAWRYGTCPECSELVVGKDQSCRHSCPSGSPAKPLNEAGFPTLRRFLYAHDVLDHPELGPHVGSAGDLGLIELSAQDVLDLPGNRAIVTSILPGINLDNVAGSIYLPKQYRADTEVQLTLAVDRCLDRESTCRSEFRETDASQRGGAWGPKLGVESWVSKDVVMLKCNFGTMKLLRNKKGFFEHACDWSREQEEERKGKPDASTKQNRKLDCRHHITQPILSPLVLPPDYLRRYWWQKRIGSKATKKKN